MNTSTNLVFWFMRLVLRPSFIRACYPLIQPRYLSTPAIDMTVDKSAHPFDKTRFDALLNRRFFYAPAFEIYGGTCVFL